MSGETARLNRVASTTPGGAYRERVWQSCRVKGNYTKNAFVVKENALDSAQNGEVGYTLVDVGASPAWRVVYLRRPDVAGGTLVQGALPRTNVQLSATNPLPTWAPADVLAAAQASSSTRPASTNTAAVLSGPAIASEPSTSTATVTHQASTSAGPSFMSTAAAPISPAVANDPSTMTTLRAAMPTTATAQAPSSASHTTPLITSAPSNAPRSTTPTSSNPPSGGQTSAPRVPVIRIVDPAVPSSALSEVTSSRLASAPTPSSGTRISDRVKFIGSRKAFDENENMWSGKALLAAMKEDPFQFTDYPYECIAEYTDKKGNHIAVGTQGQVLDIEASRSGNSCWVQVSKPRVTDRVQWVPWHSVKICTTRKFGDQVSFHSGVMLDETQLDHLAGVESSRFGTAVAAFFTAYHKNWSILGSAGNFDFMLSPQNITAGVRLLIREIGDVRPEILDVLNEKVVSFRKLCEIAPGPRKRRSDKRIVHGLDSDFDGTDFPGTYLIHYEDFPEDWKDGKTGGVDASEGYSGKSIQVRGRSTDHDSSMNYAIFAGNDHYKARRSARQNKTGFITRCLSSERRSVYEQLFTDMFVLYSDRVLMPSSAFQWGRAQTDTLARGIIPATTPTDPPDVSDVFANEREEEGLLEQSALSANPTSAENKDRWWQLVKQAQTFQAVCQSAAKASGWQDGDFTRKAAGLTGACNISSPLTEGHGGKVIITKQTLDNRNREFTRGPQSIAQSRVAASHGVTLFQVLPHTSSKSPLDTLTISSRAPAFKHAGMLVTVTFELAPDGEDHKVPFCGIPKLGAYGGHQEIRGLGVRVNWDDHDTVEPKVAYLQKRTAHVIAEEGTPGAMEGYIVGGAILRYLKQQQYDLKDPALPSWFKNYGTANIVEVEFYHMQQAWIFTQFNGRQELLLTPVLIDTATLEAKLRAIGPPSLSFQDHGYTTGIGKHTRTRCDCCFKFYPYMNVETKYTADKHVLSTKPNSHRCLRACLLNIREPFSDV